MANTQTKASTKYQKKVGLISKSYKIKKNLADEFKEVCDKKGVGQAETISKLMQQFINENK